MGWVLLLLLAALVLGGLWRFGGLRGPSLELLGAALLLGVAGYAWQGAPALPGSPTPPPAKDSQEDSLFARERGLFLERFTPDAQLLDAADAMHREGLESYGIALIRGGLEKRPRSAVLWLGMGNALTLYANGMITPAADLAFKRAAALSPGHPAAPYFTGLAYAQAGEFDRATAIWGDLLAKAPPKARWRGHVEQRLAELQAIQRMR